MQCGNDTLEFQDILEFQNIDMVPAALFNQGLQTMTENADGRFGRHR